MDALMESLNTQSRIAVLENEIKNIGIKIEDMRVEHKEHHYALCSKFDNVSTRINVLEKWRWMIVGGAIVIGYMLAHIRIENLF